jgi:hypothetical protein
MGMKECVFSPLPREGPLEELVTKDSFYPRLEERLSLSSHPTHQPLVELNPCAGVIGSRLVWLCTLVLEL